MNIRYPILYKFFMIRCCLSYLVLAYIAAICCFRSHLPTHTNVSWLDYFNFAFVPFVLFSGYEYMWQLSYGHGVFECGYIWDFPRRAVYSMIPLLLLSFGAFVYSIVHDSFGENGEEQLFFAKLSLVGGMCSFSIVLSSCRWTYTVYANTLQAFEFEVRREIILGPDKNLSIEDMNDKIKFLKDRGLIRERYQPRVYY